VTDLTRRAAMLMAPGKGILAADESVPTMCGRLERAGVAPTASHRRGYREMLVTTPGLAERISGLILCDETFRQALTDGTPFPQALAARGILPGIKVDTGAKPLPGHLGESVTEGLDGLRGRLAEYAARGAAFAKWRAVFTISGGCPSWAALRANAHALTRYALACQEAGLVPVVEPEVVMDGGHSLAQCGHVTTAALMAVLTELQEFDVRLDGLLLKTNMVLPGRSSAEDARPDDVAWATIDTLTAVVPPEVAGVAFLSGGQPPSRAAANLAAICRLPSPWPVTFSFGRALVSPALTAWHGDPALVQAGQRALACQVAEAAAALTRPRDAMLTTAIGLASVPGRA
jgi:fructose-bisphosphate aldolase, class I